MPGLDSPPNYTLYLGGEYSIHFPIGPTLHPDVVNARKAPGVELLFFWLKNSLSVLLGNSPIVVESGRIVIHQAVRRKYYSSSQRKIYIGLHILETVWLPLFCKIRVGDN